MKHVLWIMFFLIEIVFGAQIPLNFKNYLKSHPTENVKIWVLFKDKPTTKTAQLQKAETLISEKAMTRRQLRGIKKDIDVSDFSVDARYLNQVKPYALRMGQTSRWLNAVALWIRNKDIPSLTKFSFIKEIRAVGRRMSVPEEQSALLTPKTEHLHKGAGLDYGPSAFQLEQIGVTVLHDKGLSGKGVTIAMLDDGFNLYKTHDAFQILKVVAVHDFVNNDDTVDDPNAPANKGTHGTRTLSVLGGYAPGHLIGPAFGASFLLAKTEIDSAEIPLEEDNWVAGLEWAEAQGADIVSSSLGYIDWYTQQNMDGRTALTTLATVVAEQKGLIVVNSAGNEGFTRDDDVNTLIAPADGEFVITAGGVTSDNIYWSVASRGPTIDGRIKPDVSALARNTYVASPFNPQGYLQNSGTSFSCPLISGAIALLLEAYPSLTPFQVRELIHRSASIAEAPNNEIGYGILNISAAYNLAATNNGHFEPVISDFAAHNYPNPFTDYTRIPFGVKEQGYIRLTVFNALGQPVFKAPETIADGQGYFILTAHDLGAAGIYYFRLDIKTPDESHSLKVGKMLFFK